MSQATNGAAPSSSTHQLSIQRDAGFISLALLGFVGLAGIAAWLGQPMLCDLCIAEVFFISNQVAKTKSSRDVAPQPQSIEAGLSKVKIAEKKVQAEISEIVEREQVHSGKGAIPESPLPPFQAQPASPLPDNINTPEVITVTAEEVIVESPEILDVPAEEATVVIAPPEIPERVEGEVQSASSSPVSLESNAEAFISVAPVAPTETQITESAAPNPVTEHAEYLTKKPRRVSFATPPTPPVSPPRGTFAIPAGLRLQPVPVPSSILTPPLSPQLHPLDYFVGIEEEVIERENEQDEIKVFKIDDDWEDCVHEPVKVDADSSSDRPMDAEEPDQKANTEEEKQLRDQIREAFEDDIPAVNHIEDTTENIEDITQKKPDEEVKDEAAMESSMVIVDLPEVTTEKPEATIVESLVPEASKLPPPDSPQLSPRIEDDEPTSISLAQKKPALIILTPEAEESRVIFDAANSRLPSFDARAAVTSSVAAPEAKEEKVAENVTAPVISEEAFPVITSPTKGSIVFSDPFSSNFTEKEGREAERAGIIVQSLHDINPSPATKVPEEKPELLRGPYIEVDDSEDETSSPQPVLESGTKTSDELMDGITEILHKDNAEVSDVVEKAVPEATQNVIIEAAEQAIPGASQTATPEAAPLGVLEEASIKAVPAPASEIIEVVEPAKTEEVENVNQSKALPTVLVTTPMIPEDEELVIPERKVEDVARPPSSGSKLPSRPSTAKSSASEAGGSSSSIDFHGTSSSLQRSVSAPNSVVRTANSSGDPTFLSSETNANAPATAAAIQKLAKQEVLPEGKEVKRLAKIDEELEDWVDVAAEVEQDLKKFTVLIEEKDNHFISEDQYTRETREQHAIEKKAPEKAKMLEKATEKNSDIKAIAPIESTPKRPFPIPLQIQTPPKVYNSVPETDYFRAIPKVPSLAQKSGSRRVHFDIDDMVAPDSPMFILPIPPSAYGDRPGSRDSAFSRPASRDSAFSGLSNLDRSLDSINFPVMPKFHPLSIAPRMEPTMVIRDTMSVRSGTSEIGIETGMRPPGEVMKYNNSTISDWGSSIDLERGTFHGAKPSHDFAKDRDITEWVSITREGVEVAGELQRNQGKGPLLPLHRSPTESEGRGPPRRRWTLLRALSIPFSAFRTSTDLPRSPNTPNSATYPLTPDSSTFVTSPRETSGLLPQLSIPQSPLTPASPDYPNSSVLMSPISLLSPVDPIEPVIPNPQAQPLPIRLLKKLSPKGLISGASGAARKAWGLVKFFTSPTPTNAPVPMTSGVVERKPSINWLRGLDEIESGGAWRQASGKGMYNEKTLIDFGDEERRSRAREAGKRAAREGVEELREVVVISIPTA